MMPLLPASSAFASALPSFLLYAPPWPPTENPPLNFQLLFLSPLLSLVLSHHPGIPFLSYPSGEEGRREVHAVVVSDSNTR